MTTVDSNFHAPLDGEFFGRPTRQTSQRFGVTGPGRPSGSIIPHFPPSISSADFTSPSFQAVHKAEIDTEVFREKLNATLSSSISSPPKVSTAPTDNVLSSNEVFDEDQPPALSFRNAFDSDSSSDNVLPQEFRVNRQPFSVLSVDRQSTYRFSQESNYTNFLPSKSARFAILEPKPRLAWHTTYEQLLISRIQRSFGKLERHHQDGYAEGVWRGYVPKYLTISIDLWLANTVDESPDRMLVPVEGGSERPCFPHTPLMKNVPLPETTPSGGCSFEH